MAITLALIPIFLLILIGHLLYRNGFPGTSFWPSAERMLYYVLFPAMLTEKLAHASRDLDLLGRLALAVPLWMAIATALLWLWQRYAKMSMPRFTSVFQGSIRFNSYIGLAAMQTLQGDTGVAAMAVCMALLIPLVNVLSILAFSLGDGDVQRSPRQILAIMLGNPLILGCIAGMTLNALHIDLPDSIDRLLRYLGDMALPLGLLCVGAALQVRGLGRSGGLLMATVVFKLLLLPVLAALIAALLQLDALATAALVTLAALPTATASYILSRQLGGDYPLMAAIISAQTLVAMASMPLVIPLATRLVDVLAA